MICFAIFEVRYFECAKRAQFAQWPEQINISQSAQKAKIY